MTDNEKDIAITKDEIDVERHFLESTVTLSDGSEGLVFSRGPRKNETGHFIYNCHLCGVSNLFGERSLHTHIAGRKHQSKLSQRDIDAEIFRTPLTLKTKTQMNIAPGEPVPPGFENEVKPMPEIQGFLNKYKENALIGVEYALEISSRHSSIPSYLCLMCDKRGDSKLMISHWTSYNHRLKYLEKHFPSVVKELVPYRYNPDARNIMPRIIQTVVEAIEDHYGRLSPTVIDNNELKKNRNKIVQEIFSDKHFDEKSGPNFLDIVDKNVVDNLIKGSKAIPINIDTTKKRDMSPLAVKTKRLKSDTRKDNDSFDSISSESDTSLSNTPGYSNKKKMKSQSPVVHRVVPRVKRSPPFEEECKIEKKITLPTPKELSAQATAITNERYKWEKYRCLVEMGIKDLEKKLKEYEKSPEKHPLYPEEWKKFWNRRYKELQTEKKDPNKYDYKPEWIIFWTKRMKELHDEEIERKKKEIKKKLGLSEGEEEKTDQLKQQYKIKTPIKKNESPPIIDISDDEGSIISQKKTFRRSRSGSLSSFSDDYDRHSRDRTQDRVLDREKSRDRERERSREPHYNKEKEIYCPPSSGPPTDYYRHPKPGYYPPSTHPSQYSYRTMDPFEIPQYEPKKPIESEKSDDDPLTVVAVLRLLTALEEHLGSLGPKVVDLLAKALALEKVKANSSDEMLLNEDNCVFFETIKEKLKGQLITNVLDSHKVKVVKKAIKNIAAVIHQVNEKLMKKSKEKENEKEEESKSNQKDLPFDRKLIASKLAAALVVHEKTDVSTEDMDKLIHVFILMVKESKERDSSFEVKDILMELNEIPLVEIKQNINVHAALKELNENKEFALDMFDPNDDDDDDAQPQSSSGALESLTDSDLQTLLQNFKHLSSEEQHHLIAHLKKLESTDPIRVEKLRRFVDLSNLKHEKNNSLHKEHGEKNATENSNEKKISMYSDDEDVQLQKVIDSDDDDDDYNFADVVKAASNNIKDSKNKEESMRSHSLSREPDADISNMSKASSSSTVTTNLNTSLSDTQNLIENLMGSLQKYNNAFGKQQSMTPGMNLNDGNMISTTSVAPQSNTRRDGNLPFYQQLPMMCNQNFPVNSQNPNMNINSTHFNQQGNFNPSQLQGPPILSNMTNPINNFNSNMPFDFNHFQPNQFQQMLTNMVQQQGHQFTQQQQQQQHEFQQRDGVMGARNHDKFF